MARRPLASVHPIDVRPLEEPASNPLSAEDAGNLAMAALIAGAAETNSSVIRTLQSFNNAALAAALSQGTV